MSEKAIDVVVISFPDGQHVYFEAMVNKPDYWHQVIQAWKESLSPERSKELSDAGTDCVAGTLKILRKDFNNLKPTMNFSWPQEQL